VVTLRSDALADVQDFCERWSLSVEIVAVDGPHAVLVVGGPTLAVRGLTEIIGMYRG
jgi:hypothetical protein